MNTFLKAANSKIVWFNTVTTLFEVSFVVDGLLPQKYLIYSTTAKSILTIILRVWFNSAPPSENP